MEKIPTWHHIPSNTYNPHAWIIGEPDIGEGVWIGPFCVIDGSGDLSIGNHTEIAAGAQIYTHSTVRRALGFSDGPPDRRATRVGERCHIGAGAIILMGSSIGDHSVVGASAVVLEGTFAPAGSLLVGNPARVTPRSRE